MSWASGRRSAERGSGHSLLVALQPARILAANGPLQGRMAVSQPSIRREGWEWPCDPTQSAQLRGPTMIGPALIASIPHKDLIAGFNRRPPVGVAIWRETLIDAAIFREAITNNSAKPCRL